MSDNITPEHYRAEIAMLNKGAVRAVMTGSGSAVFGLFESREEAVICAEKLKQQGYFAQVCETVPHGIVVIEQ